MCHFKHLRVFGVASALIALSACGSEPPVEEEPPLRVDAASAAFVNGDPVFVEDVELEAAAQGVIAPGESFGPSHPDYDTILDQMIDQKLMAQEALKRGLTQDPVAQRRLQTARERILGNILVESLVASDVTEARIAEMYEEQVALQQLDDEVRVSHIVADTESEAAELYTELMNGADFADIAREHSIDRATRLDGGSLGYIVPGDLPSTYAAMIGNTETGTMSEPFESENGWIILRVEDRRTEAPQTLEQMRPEIVTFLTYSEISRILKELRVEAIIERRPGNAPEGRPERETSPLDPGRTGAGDPL